MRWEIFLIDASKKKCMKYMRLSELIIESIKNNLQPTPGHTAAETVGTSLLDEEHGYVSSQSD